MAAPDQTDPKQDKPETGRPQRREQDSAEAEPERGRLTTREIFKRMRRPMIGLGMVGVAVPMVNATNAAEREKEAAATQAGLGRTTAGGDTEEQLAEQIALTQAEQAREAQVSAAVEKYGIERDLAEDIFDIALEEDIDPQLAYGLVKTESTFDERAKSHVGARGLTQVMPRTAAWLVPGTSTEDLYDRQTNLRLGFKYLDQMIDKYKGNVRLALLAYNRGPGTVDKVLKRGGDPNNGYADKVLRG